jgi:hypothetical protein
VTLTNFPDGVSSFGVPVIGGGSGPFKPYATYYFVDANNFTGNASDGNTGQSPEEPFTTMSAAFNAVNSGDVITFIGNIREQLDTPEGIFDVTVIGGSNSPRNADAFTSATTGDTGRTRASWVAPASPTASTPLCRVLQQGWRFQNFLFGAAPAATASVVLYRDGGSGDEERDSSHASFYGMRFDSSPMGIQASGGPAFITVSGCLFARATTTAIANTVGAGIGTNLNWNIVGNRFFSNVNHIVVPTSGANIVGNTFQAHTTMAIDLNGGVATNNISENALSGTYSIAGGYRGAGAGDQWAGNYNELSATVGITSADPA